MGYLLEVLMKVWCCGRCWGRWTFCEWIQEREMVWDWGRHRSRWRGRGRSRRWHHSWSLGHCGPEWGDSWNSVGRTHPDCWGTVGPYFGEGVLRESDPVHEVSVVLNVLDTDGVAIEFTVGWNQRELERSSWTSVWGQTHLSNFLQIKLMSPFSSNFDVIW